MNHSDSQPRDSLMAHAALVRAVARAVLRGDDRVEDVVQDTWVVALEAASSRRGPLRPWLAGIARNKALRLLRGQRRRERMLSELRSRSQAPRAEDLAERAELGRRVVAALLALDDPYRETLLLRFQEGLPPREIAARQGVPVETVKTRLKRGLARLRASLEESHEKGARALRLALLPLAYPRALGSVGTATSLLLPVGGWIVMKKALVFATLMLVLVGSVFVLGPLFRGSPSDRGVEGTGVGTRLAGDGAGPRLVGGGAPTLQDRARTAFPPPVDLATIDRDLDLHGIVVDAEGKPIAGADLEAVQYPWRERNLLIVGGGADEGVPLGTTRAATDGTFRIPLARGRQVGLRVRAAGYAPLELRQLRAGERVRVELGVGVILGVVVRGVDGRPVEGAWCRLRSDAASPHEVVVVGTSGSDGRVEFAGLPIAATLRGWATPPAGVRGSSSAFTLTLPARGRMEYEVVLGPRGRTVAGRVLDAENDAPIPGARVSTVWSMLPSQPTDAEGRFEVGGASIGPFAAVYGEADGYARGLAALKEGQEATLRLERGWAVRGRVIDPAGSGIPGVLLRAVGSRFRDRPDDYSLASARSSDDGTFTVDHLRRDRPHTLILQATGHGTLMLDVDPPTEDRLDVGDVILPEARTIYGRVRDRDGFPMARVFVVLRGFSDGRSRLRPTLRTPVNWNYQPSMSRRSDDLGRFSFPDLAPGSYRLIASDGHGDSIDVEVRVDDGDVTQDLVLAGARTLRITLRGDDGTPIQDAAVTWWLRHRSQARLEPDADGVVELVSPREPIELRVYLGSDAPYAPCAPISVAADQDSIDVVLERVSLLRGRLVGPGDRPLASGIVVASWPEGRASAVTDADGRFLIRIPRNQKVDLSFDGSFRLPKTIPEVEQSLLTVQLDGVEPATGAVVMRARAVRADRTLTVRLLDPSGRAVSGGEVRLLRVPSHATPVRSEADGRVHLEDLPALPIRIRWRFEASSDRPWFVPTPDRVVPAGQEVVIRARRAARIRGTVTGADGRPAAAARVGARLDGTHCAFTRSDDGGGFVLYLDPAGSRVYEVYAYVQHTSGKLLMASVPGVEVGAEGVSILLPGATER